MIGPGGHLVDCCDRCVGLGLQLLATVPLNLGSTLSQSGEKAIDLLSHFGGGAKASVRHRLLACPVPDGFVGVQIRAVRWQSHQAQGETWRGQITPYR